MAAVGEVDDRLAAGLLATDCCQCRQLTGSPPEQASLAIGTCSLRGSYSSTVPPAGHNC